MKDPRRMHRKRDEAGAIGIGTLIVFIAMVLVAVIAAAVIIKTASELEQSAERYGQDASEETGLSIKVQHFEGFDDGTGNEIDELNIYIVLYGGKDALNMLDVVVHIAGDDNEPGGVVGFSEDFLHNNAPNPGGFPTYTVTEISDPLDSYQAGSEYLLDSEATLRLEFTGLGTVLNDGLSPLSFVSLKFMISGGGATTTESATTPGSYSTNGVYLLK